MARKRLNPERQALVDQVVAILRDADGFPMSTGEIAQKLGDHMPAWSFKERRPLIPPRPPCWPDDLVDPELGGQVYCERCGGRFHRPPVWRSYQAADVRPLLNRLAKAGEVEKLAFPDVTPRRDYWRREDTDR